jgi:hypothetical protein
VNRSVDSSFWRDEIQILQKFRILNDIFVRRFPLCNKHRKFYVPVTLKLNQNFCKFSSNNWIQKRNHKNSVADPDVYLGSRIRLFSIPDTGSELFPSRIRIKEYDPDCSSRIPDPDPDFLPMPDPGVKNAPDPGARIRIRNTAKKVPNPIGSRFTEYRQRTYDFMVLNTISNGSEWQSENE